jgi:hypothetical protein
MSTMRQKRIDERIFAYLSDLFGVPPSVRALPLTDPAPAPTLGLVVLNREPVSPIARALLAATENLTLQPHFDTNCLPPDSTTST